MSPAGQEISGFRYLWMKRVVGFNSTAHCAKCLKGNFIEEIGPDLESFELTIPAEHGDVFYLCGVAHPSNHRNNLHLALRAQSGASTEVQAYSGDRFEISGASGIPFDDAIARKAYPHLPERFLGCRNFQFGAQEYLVGSP